jgi:Predicted thioesterase
MDDVERVETSEVRIPYRDIDPDGRMRAAAYVDHAETALAHFWRYRPPLEDEPLFVTSKVECRLFHPLRLDDLVRMTVRIDKIGGKSIGFNVVMEKGGDTAAEVELVRTALDRETGEPVALPEDTRDWLYSYLR